MKKSRVGGLVFVGCMMAGMGIGMALGNMVAGMFIGMGVGFAGRAILMISDSEKEQHSSETPSNHE